MRRLNLSITILLFAAFSLQAQVRIKMKQENGVYTTPCTVNGLKLRFIFDTGASNVSISLSEALFMLKNGYLDEEDLKGSSYSQIANGDVVQNTTVNLKELEIGGIKLQNIEAIIVHDLSAPLLLGQSAIQKLGKIELEGDDLVIVGAESPLSLNACLDAQKLIKEAKKYYFDDLKTLSADTYQRAYDLCPDTFTCSNIELMGVAYYQSKNYLPAIKYLEKASYCTSETRDLYFINMYIGQAYLEIGEPPKATLYLEKALSFAENEFDKSYCYSMLGNLYASQENYDKAIDYLEKSMVIYMMYKSFEFDDLINGKVKDQVLGEILWNIGFFYSMLDLMVKANRSIFLASLCGYETAIIYCKKFGINHL